MQALSIFVAMECANRSKDKIIHKCYVNQLSIKLYRAIQLITHRIDNQLSQSAMLFLRVYRNVGFWVCV